MKAYINAAHFQSFHQMAQGASPTFQWAPYASFTELLAALDIVVANEARAKLPQEDEAKFLNPEQFQLLINLQRRAAKLLRINDLSEIYLNPGSIVNSEAYQVQCKQNLTRLAALGYLTFANDEEGVSCTILPLKEVAQANKNEKKRKGQTEASSKKTNKLPRLSKKEPKIPKAKKIKLENPVSHSSSSSSSLSSSLSSSFIANLSNEHQVLKEKYERLKRLYYTRETHYLQDKQNAFTFFSVSLGQILGRNQQEHQKLVEQLELFKTRVQKLEKLQGELKVLVRQSVDVVKAISSDSSSSSDLDSDIFDPDFFSSTKASPASTQLRSRISTPSALSDLLEMQPEKNSVTNGLSSEQEFGSLLPMSSSEGSLRSTSRPSMTSTQCFFSSVLPALAPLFNAYSPGGNHDTELFTAHQGFQSSGSIEVGFLPPNDQGLSENNPSEAYLDTFIEQEPSTSLSL